MLPCRESREPLDRRKDEPLNTASPGRPDENYGREPLVERRSRDRSKDRRGREYRDTSHGERCYPECPPGELDRRQHRDKSTDRSNRGDHRGSDPRYSPKPKSDPTGRGSVNERRPERLMGGHSGGTNVIKDLDAAYDQQYPVGSSKSSHLHNHVGGDAYDVADGDRFDESSASQHLDPSSAVSKTSRNRRKLESMLRNDSLSSDPSDCVRPPPPKPHKPKKTKKQRQASFSSSDDEIQTTPECTSCDELELESESISEKGTSPRHVLSRLMLYREFSSVHSRSKW